MPRNNAGSKLVPRIGSVLFLLYVVLLLTRHFVAESSKVMYADGRVDRGIVYKLDYKFRKPMVGEQVIFMEPGNRSKRLADFVTDVYEDVSIINRKEIPGEVFVTVKRGTQETVLPLKEMEGCFVSFSLIEKEARK